MVAKGVWSALCLLVLCAGLAPGAPHGGQKVKVTEKLIEGFESRIDVMVQDVAREGLLEDAAIEDVCGTLHAPVSDFFAAHPIEELPASPFGNAPSVFRHATFAEFLESDAWLAALDSALANEPRALLLKRRQQREDVLRESMVTLVEGLVTQGLILTKGEAEALRPVMGKACEEWFKEGAIQGDDVFNPGSQGRDALFYALRDAGLMDALSENRREVVTRFISEKGRDALDEYWLEVEFYLGALEETPAVERQRRLLRGAAEAKWTREGRTPRPIQFRLMYASTSKADKFWQHALEGILEVPEGEELPALPSEDSKTLIQARTDFLLAALDLRACFSKEQLAGLTPLLEKYAEQELGGPYSRGSMTPELPMFFPTNTETLFVTGPSPWNRPNAAQKAQVSTLLENCSDQQKEALDA